VIANLSSLPEGSFLLLAGGPLTKAIEMPDAMYDVGGVTIE